MRSRGQENIISGTIFFDPMDRIYADHFPGRPVVPGSFIIKGFVDALVQCSTSEQSIQGITVERFRFKRFVTPGTYDYFIGLSQKRVQCTLSDKELVVADGVISFEGR